MAKNEDKSVPNDGKVAADGTPTHPKDPTNPGVDVATGSDTKPVPDNVEALERTHVRTTTSQSSDLPMSGTPSVATPAVLPRLENEGPTKQSTGVINTDEASKEQFSNFLGISGYKRSDVIGSSKTRRTFVTSNGGKYELSPKGKKVRVLAGPTPPGKAEEEGDDD